MNEIDYRKLKNYKYQMLEDYELAIDIINYDIDTEFIKLNSGLLQIMSGYAWDGPSGPTIDTKNFIRGSLIHDAFYQLIRDGNLPYSYKKYADLLLRDICMDDGMSHFRASYVYLAVKWFGLLGLK